MKTPPKVTLTFECDIDIAGFLMAIYAIYADPPDIVDSPSIVTEMLPHALAYLRDQLSYHVIDGNHELVNRLYWNTENYTTFREIDWPTIRDFVATGMPKSRPNAKKGIELE